MCCLFFFFKQKTAYEMRISDWSSDVCSSDLRLPHNTQQIAQLSRPIRKSQLKAGDFVFFNTLNRPFSHMGIYIGNAQFVNAPSSGGRVRVDSLNNPYFAKRFDSARTLFGSCAALTAFGLFLSSAERRVGKAWVITCRSR